MTDDVRGRQGMGESSPNLPDGMSYRTPTPLFDRHAAAVLDRLRDVLWPPEDPDADWSPDTIQTVAEVLVANGYGPVTPAHETGAHDDEAVPGCPTCDDLMET